MNLDEIAAEEETDVLQLFVRAVRLFGRTTNSASGDYNRWKQDPNILPGYMAEYAKYWAGFRRTDTHRSRSRT